MVSPNFNSDDYYQVLGLPKHSDEAAVRKAYRKLAMKYHPDKNVQNPLPAEKKFKKIAEAYGILSDEKKKKLYDQYGKAGIDPSYSEGPPPGSGGFGGGGFRPSRGGGGGGFGNAQEVNIDPAMFAQFFGGGQPGRGARGGMGSHGGDMGGTGGGMGGGMGGMGGFDLGSLFGGLGGMGGGMGGMGGQQGFGGMGGQQQGFGSPGPQPKRQRTSSGRSDRIDVGATVVLVGLRSRPELNGTTARVQAHDASDPSHFRYSVMAKAGSMRVKPINVVEAVNKLKLTGIKSNPEMNGKTGEVVGYNPETNRYQVKLYYSGQSFSVRASSIIWPKDTHVRITGLMSAPQHNGKWGTVTHYQANGRANVKLDDGNSLAVHPDKIGIAAA